MGVKASRDRRLGGRAAEQGQEGGNQTEHAIEKRGRASVQRVLGQQLGEVDAWTGYLGGSENVEDGLGDNAVSDGCGVDGI
jgi:hypothetical protein